MKEEYFIRECFNEPGEQEYKHVLASPRTHYPYIFPDRVSAENTCRELMARGRRHRTYDVCTRSELRESERVWLDRGVRPFYYEMQFQLQL